MAQQYEPAKELLYQIWMSFLGKDETDKELQSVDQLYRNSIALVSKTKPFSRLTQNELIDMYDAAQDVEDTFEIHLTEYVAGGGDIKFSGGTDFFRWGCQRDRCFRRQVPDYQGGMQRCARE